MALVSVIIPCYNGGDFLSHAIQSAMGQIYHSVEIVVVDDGSTDNSPSIIEAYGTRIKAIRQPNSGLARARNVGIRASGGKFLAFLDADDWWREDFLQKMTTALETSGAGIAYCGWQNVGLPGGRGKPFVPPDYEHDGDKLALLLQGPRWPVHAALVRRDIAEDAGGFDPRWSSCEDFAFWLRTATQHPLVRVREVLAFYRHHDLAQMTKKRDVMALNHWLVQREFLRRQPNLAKRLGRSRVRDLTHGELLKRGYTCYWDRELGPARKIFRRVMLRAYGSPNDWKYMLPSLLPMFAHKFLIDAFEQTRETSP